jgi:hypothetical protein
VKPVGAVVHDAAGAESPFLRSCVQTTCVHFFLFVLIILPYLLLGARHLVIDRAKFSASPEGHGPRKALATDHPPELSPHVDMLRSPTDKLP